MIQVAVLNQSSVVEDADLPAVVAALQKQVRGEFANAWGIDATLTLLARGATPPAGAWQLVILDDSDQAGALGYHDVTAAGLPLGKVFAKSTIADGGQWTVTASHELLEMLVDPGINLSVFAQGRRGGNLYAYEVCDAVEEATYLIDGIAVSDFVLPSYFEEQAIDGAAPAGPYDHLGQLSEPLPALLAGGYISVFHVGPNSGWRQVSAADARPHGSRRVRRMAARDAWRRSAQ